MICTFYKILIGTTIIGITTGVIGCFTLLNKQSLLGDTIAHATLPGLAGIFLLTLKKSYTLLLCGAALSGLMGAFAVYRIIQETKLKKDAALGIILSTFFGAGIVLLTIIQKIPTAHQGGIAACIFGQATTLLQHDILLLSIISCIVLSTVIIIWKELVIISFDPIYAKTIGLPVQKIYTIFISLLILTIIIGLQTIGLILISSFLIAPAVAARQWTSQLKTMIILSIFFSLIATIGGTIISYTYPNLPTGPIIVIIATIISLVSIFYKKYDIYIKKTN